LTERKKFTQTIVNKILASLASGNTRKVSALAAGISVRTLSEWMDSDEEFAQSVHEAEGTFEAAQVGTITTASKNGDWRAALTLLERRNPIDWGRIDRADFLVRQELAKLAVERLRGEGILDVTEAEVLKEFAIESRKALPDGTKAKK
jgi:hypothetical protein